MRSRRARLLRIAVALVNLVAALVALVAVALFHERPEPPAPRVVSLPEGFSEGQVPVRLPFAPADVPAPRSHTSAYEDFMVLADAPSDFEATFRVVFATLDAAPAERECIVEPRRGGEQLVLVVGERMGSWLLLAIDPEVTEPRAVRLRFRDLRRGEEVVAVLAPAV